MCGVGVLGTPHHCLYCCPGLRQEWRHSLWTLQHRSEQAPPEDLLWTSGLIMDTTANFAFRLVDDMFARVFGSVYRSEGVIASTAFTDGFLQSKRSMGGQPGMGFVERSAGAASVRIAYYGLLLAPLLVQRRILRAEL